MHLRRVPFQDPLHLWDPYLSADPGELLTARETKTEAREFGEEEALQVVLKLRTGRGWRSAWRRRRWNRAEETPVNVFNNCRQ
jgi:hypothetical protein